MCRLAASAYGPIGLAQRRTASPIRAPGSGPIICGRGLVTWRRRSLRGVARVHVDDDVAQPGVDRGGGVLEVDLEAGAAGHRAVGEAGMDAEVLGEQHRRHRVAHAVDVGEREAGVGERSFDHRDFEGAAREARALRSATRHRRCRRAQPHRACVTPAAVQARSRGSPRRGRRPPRRSSRSRCRCRRRTRTPAGPPRPTPCAGSRRCASSSPSLRTFGTSLAKNAFWKPM